uniref:Uncharacterized protein n=1 Tax=viral metagenome TaxID=1070528 RepID=A0A6M3JJG0_9ZZZZ
MKAEITIRMDNAAFDDDGELARIIRRLADDLGTSKRAEMMTLRDINGNMVGTFEIV